MQRNFGPLKQQVDEWRAMQLSTAAAKLLIYQAFIEEETGFPKHLARRVHELYFQPLRLAMRNGFWTKPLRGRNQADVQFVAPEIHPDFTSRLVP
jgi:hypothetical protein